MSNTIEDEFDDGTTAFGEDEVDAIVYLPPSDNPELRASQRPAGMTPQFHPANPAPVPPDDAPVETWTPPTDEQDVTTSAPKTPEIVGKAASAATNTVVRVAVSVALVALPLLAAWWLIRTGMSIYGR